VVAVAGEGVGEEPAEEAAAAGDDDVHVRPLSHRRRPA
jgi:hypothetical protein